MQRISYKAMSVQKLNWTDELFHFDIRAKFALEGQP